MKIKILDILNRMINSNNIFIVYFLFSSNFCYFHGIRDGSDIQLAGYPVTGYPALSITDTG